MNEAEYAIEYVYLQFIREENIAFDRDRLPDFEYGDYIVDLRSPRKFSRRDPRVLFKYGNKNNCNQ